MNTKNLVYLFIAVLVIVAVAYLVYTQYFTSPKQPIIQNQTITIYCSSAGCAPQETIFGAGTLARDCYRTVSECQTYAKSVCISDQDCVGDVCCHPTACVNISSRGVCNQLCTQNCQGPLDCGVGSCKCVNGQCAVAPAAS